MLIRRRDAMPTSSYMYMDASIEGPESLLGYGSREESIDDESYDDYEEDSSDQSSFYGVRYLIL